MSDSRKQLSRKPRQSSRLLKHADFQAVYERGRKHFSGNMTVFYRRRDDNAGPRVGFTVGKVLGGAVVRNRIRRRMRAAVQNHLQQLSLPLDLVLHPRKQVLDMDFARLDREVAQIMAAVQAAQKGRTK